MHQAQVFIVPYEDHSGLTGKVAYDFIDLKTGYTKRMYFDTLEFTFWYGTAIWRAMNDFIVEDCNVWNEDVYKDLTVYRTTNALPKM